MYVYFYMNVAKYYFSRNRVRNTCVCFFASPSKQILRPSKPTFDRSLLSKPTFIRTKQKFTAD